MIPSPKLKIRLYGDPCLRQKATAIKNVGVAERMLIQSMIETMYYEKGVGLAAPQVGISKRIFVVDVGEGPWVFINPSIMKCSEETIMEEGCLSIPGINLNIKRPRKIWIRYTDEEGQSHEQTFDELLARVFLHEYDHLEGKLIIDYASKDQMKKIKSRLNEITKKAN